VCLIVILVPSGRAEGHISGVLLDGGLGPAAESREIGEGRAVVVVGIPDRVKKVK
jgi:hypothetical protein